MATRDLDLYPLDQRWLAELHELHRDPDVMRFIRAPDVDRAQTQKTIDEMLRCYKAHRLGLFPAFERASGAFVGWGLLYYSEGVVGGDLELGYRLHKRAWGKGYATQIGEALLSYAQSEHRRDYVMALTMRDHVVSQRVLGKIGFADEGVVQAYGATLRRFGWRRPS